MGGHPDKSKAVGLSVTALRDFRGLYREHYGFVWASVRRLGVVRALADDAARAISAVF